MAEVGYHVRHDSLPYPCPGRNDLWAGYRAALVAYLDQALSLVVSSEIGDYETDLCECAGVVTGVGYVDWR